MAERPPLDKDLGAAELKLSHVADFEELVNTVDAIVLGTSETVTMVEQPFPVAVEHFVVESIEFNRADEAPPAVLDVEWPLVLDEAQAIVTSYGRTVPVAQDEAIYLLRQVEPGRWTPYNSSARLLVTEDGRLRAADGLPRFVSELTLGSLRELIAATPAPGPPERAEVDRELEEPIGAMVEVAGPSGSDSLYLVRTRGGFCYVIGRAEDQPTNCFPLEGGLGADEIIGEWRGSTLYGVVGPNVTEVQVYLMPSETIQIIPTHEVAIAADLTVRVFVVAATRPFDGANFTPPGA